MTSQTMEFNLGYDEEKKKYTRINFEISNEKVIATFFISDDEEFKNMEVCNPVAEFETVDFIVNRNYSKTKLSNKPLNKIMDLKFSFSKEMYDFIFENLDKEIKETISSPYQDALSESYFKENGALLTSYNTIIKNIKKDNLIKKKFGIKTYSINYYRQYIDKYFPKIENNIEFNKSLDTKQLNIDYEMQSFNEMFEQCKNDIDVLSLSENITPFLNLTYCTNSDDYILKTKKYNNFVKVAVLYSKNINKNSTIQNVIDVLNELKEIYNGNIYNDLTQKIIDYYKTNGDNNYLIYFYKKTFGNKMYLSQNEKNSKILDDLNDVVYALEHIKESDNYYKYQKNHLEVDNKIKEEVIKKEKDKYEILKERYEKIKKTIKMIGIIVANIIGAVTIIFAIFKKFKKRK